MCKPINCKHMKRADTITPIWICGYEGGEGSCIKLLGFSHCGQYER